jgi:hypothetical protein
MAAGVVMINGVSYSANNVTFIMYGVPIAGITALSYTKKQDKVNNKAFQVEPVSRGYGNSDYECSIEIYKEEWVNIINSAPNNDPTQIPPSTFQVIYSGDSVNYKEDQLLFAEFPEDPMNVAAGDTSIKLTIPVLIGGITHL